MGFNYSQPLSSAKRNMLSASLMKAGISLGKIDKLREIFEESGYSLSSSTHLRQLVPFVLHEEIMKIKQEISGRPVAIIFDGTTHRIHVAEAFVLVLRFVDDWVVKQQVGRLILLAKSLKGEEVARLLVQALSTELGISSNLIIAAMRDRASVNSVAMCTVRVLYNRIFDVGCISHTLDLVGERMNTPVLDVFVKSWIGMFSRSPKTRLAWTTQTGLPPQTYSATRWWSKFEVISQIHDTFGDVSTFCKSSDLPTASSGKLTDILNDPARCRKLKIELAITVDSMAPFVRATYNLEGDGLLALTAYRHLSELQSTIMCEYYPNVNALAKQESKGNSSHERQLVEYTKNCVKPAHDYF